MPRKPRIHYPGAFYHVILRGNAGAPIFFDDRDQYRLYLIFQYAVEKFRCRIHAFCLMGNHLHIVMEVDDIPLSRIMQNISQRFTKWINYTQSRTGHVFQGRYKAVLVDADAYLFELVRYVHLNPVRAGAVTEPEDHPWTGHGCYLGKELLPWLTTNVVLAMLSPRIGQARKAYESFVRDGMGVGRRVEFHSGMFEGRILGDESFADETLFRAGQKGDRVYALDEVVAMVCSRFQITETKLRMPGKVRPMTEARAVAAAVVQLSPHLRLTDLARLLGRDLSALGKAVQRVMNEKGASALAWAIVEELKSSTQISETLA